MAMNAASIHTMYAVYHSTRPAPDPAIERGLTAAGFQLQHTKTIAATLDAIKTHLAHRVDGLVLAAEVQSGAIPLLMLLEEQMLDVPPSLLLDLTGEDIRMPVQALQYDVEEYLLASDPELHREARARVLAERVIMHQLPPSNSPSASSFALPMPMAVPATALNGYAHAYTNGNGHSNGLHIDAAQLEATGNTANADLAWDPVAHVIHSGEIQLRLSPIQARIFDRLWTHRNATVTMKELVAAVLLKSDIDVDEGVRLLRPHLVRLRSKLESCPDLAHRIINVRGNGYMMI